MRYSKLFKKLTPLSCVALGTDYYGKTIPERDACGLLEQYLELGGNVVDTAHVYSDYLPGEKHMSEKVIGRWMKSEGTRKAVVLCTKGGFPEIGDMHASRIDLKNIMTDLAESLDCLQTDSVDIYWLHRDNPDVPAGEIAGWMDGLQRTGAFTYWGVSNWKHERIEEITEYCCKNGLEPPVCSQIKWSLAIPNPGSAGDDTLTEMDAEEHRWYLDHPMPVFAYSSQAKGFFWKLRRTADGIADPGGKAGKRYFNEENIARFGQLEALSAETGLSPGQLSAAWMTRPGTIPVIPIIGAHSPEQLADSVSGAEAEIDGAIAGKYDIFRRDHL
ncbi:MAG: aldo/keto reductase [Clostridia bacterium]|nr:aldo/keto reductase [Clostridia bacterium]